MSWDFTIIVSLKSFFLILYCLDKYYAWIKVHFVSSSVVASETDEIGEFKFDKLFNCMCTKFLQTITVLD